LDLRVEPKGHVAVMGEPSAGRSDLIEALSRVLDADASRTRIATELDFHDRDTSQPIQISLTLADLGPDLQQQFFDHLEFWDTGQARLLAESETPEAMDQERYEWVLRLEYRARWLPAEERCEEWVHYPKESDPGSDTFTHVRRRDIADLGFGVLHWGRGRILDLGSRSAFRRVIDRASGDDFATALDQYVKEVTQAAGQFSNSSQVKDALESVVAPLRELLSIQSTDLSQLIQFAPEGGSPSGLLRSLGPSLDFDDGSGSLPAWRRGATIASLFRIAEALALSWGGDKILAIDDLGDGLDAGSAAHLAFVMRKSAGQVWVTTRVPSVAEVFEPQEVARLGRDGSGVRFIRQGKPPASKAESITAKHWHRNLLPALSYRSVVVVEGPNDFAVFHSLALRLANEHNQPLPVTQGVSIISAGFTGSGGYASVLRLAGTARDTGLRSIAVVDGDTTESVKKFVQDNQGLANAVIRLPEGAAIEVALLRDLPDDIVRQALVDALASASLTVPPGLDQLTGKNLTDMARSLIKKDSLHSQFIEALPAGSLPPLAVRVLKEAVQSATGATTGVVQL
jgi:hypothetical protein